MLDGCIVHCCDDIAGWSVGAAVQGSFRCTSAQIFEVVQPAQAHLLLGLEIAWLAPAALDASLFTKGYKRQA